MSASQETPVSLQRLLRAIRSAAPPLLWGVRLWVSVCLALYVAFWLQLGNAFWASVGAAMICQPTLGSTLRRAGFNVAGTTVGGVAGVVLSAFFPQEPVGFLLGLAIWVSACSFVATILRNAASYGAGMAGITAAIIASNTLGQTGGTNGEAFTIAVTRASEVCVGVISAGLVLASTDFGDAARQLSAQFATLSAEIAGQLVDAFRLSGPEQALRRAVRHEMIRRVTALDPIINDAIGESSEMRYHSRLLLAAMDGLFSALSGWRTVANHLGKLQEEERRLQSEVVLARLPLELSSASIQAKPAIWATEPSRINGVCLATARGLIALPAQTPSLRLLVDRTAEALFGISRALNGLALLANEKTRFGYRDRRVRLHPPDWLPAVVNAGRSFLTLGAVEVFWIVTAWPNGGPAMIFATIAAVMFATMGDQAFGVAMSALLGCGIGAVLAGIVKFSVLPHIQTFAGFCLVIGVVLIPTGIFASRPPIFLGMTLFFTILLGAANQMTYDAQQFYNTAMAISGGLLAAALAFRVIPPLSPATRSRRLLTLTLRDLRQLSSGSGLSIADWESHIYGRLSALPEAAEPLQRGQLVAALSVGTEIIRVRRIVDRFDIGGDLESALGALARGDSTSACDRLLLIDRTLANLPSHLPGRTARLRARGSLLTITEALTQYPDYFDTGATQ